MEDSAYQNMDNKEGLEYSAGVKEQPKKKKNKLLFIVPCLLVVVGVVVAVVLASSSSSSTNQNFCTQCTNNDDCNSCIGLPRTTSGDAVRAECNKQSDTDSTGQCACRNDVGNGNGWFGTLNTGGCQNLNNLAQREALFELYDALDGDNWVRSSGNPRFGQGPQLWKINATDDEGEPTGGETVENNDQSYCQFEYVKCTNPDQNGLVEIEEFYALTDECYDGGTDVVLNPGCEGIGVKGVLPDSFGDLIKLKEVRFDNPGSSDQGTNELTGELPETLPQLVNLEVFDVSRNLLTGPLPEDIGNLTQLRILGLSRNRISTVDKESEGFTGEIPASIEFLQGLTTLDLSDNSLSGEIPPEIGMLTSLETVLLNNNLLTGSIPDEVQFLTTARTLALYQNNLEGTLEREVDGELFCPVCEMIGLERLQIGPIQGVGQGDTVRNRIGGNIPTKINQLKDLVTLALNDNQLEGCLPDSLADLNNADGDRAQALQEIAFQNNQLGQNGTEACSLDVLGRMDQLRQLALRNNRFQGATLPASFGNLVNLENFYIDHMGLVGEIPDELEGVITRAKAQQNCCIQFDRVPTTADGGEGTPDCFATQLLNFPAVVPPTDATCQMEEGQPVVDLTVVDAIGVGYPSNEFVNLPAFVCDTRMVLVDDDGNLDLDDEGNIVITNDAANGIPLGCDGAEGRITTADLGNYPFLQFPYPEPSASLPDCDEATGYSSFEQVPDGSPLGENEAVIVDIEKGKSKCKVDRTVTNWCINSDITLPRSSPTGGSIGGQNACRNFN